MKNRGKKLHKIILGTCLTALLLAMPALAAGEGMVDDRAGLLSGTETAELTKQAQSLASANGYDFMLVTTDDAEGKDTTTYAEDYFMDHKTTLDGVVYLIDMDNRELWVATSGEMIYYLTDDRIESLLDDATPYASDDEYASCFQAFLDGTSGFIQEGIPEDQYTINTETGEITRYVPPKKITAVEALIAAVAALVAGGGIFGAVAGKYTMKWGNYSYSVSENSSVRLRNKEDHFVNRIVTQRRIPKDPPPSSGGGGGSASSVHTGSGGNSFGGGGRSF